MRRPVARQRGLSLSRTDQEDSMFDHVGFGVTDFGRLPQAGGLTVPVWT